MRKYMLIMLFFTQMGVSTITAQSAGERPLYVGGMAKFIGGLGGHVEFPINSTLTLRGAAGWLIFILDFNGGMGFALSPKIEVYGTFHVTIMSFFGRTAAYGPEIGADLRLTDVFHIEGGAVYLMNASNREWLPNVGISLNIPLRP